MTLVDTLLRNPQIPHGTIKIGFTADEEIGSGIEKFRRRAVRRADRLHGRRRRAGRDQRRDVERPDGDCHVQGKEHAPRHGQGRDGQLDLRARRLCRSNAQGHASRDDRGSRGLRASVCRRRRRRTVERQGSAARLRARGSRREGARAAGDRDGDRAPLRGRDGVGRREGELQEHERGAEDPPGADGQRARGGASRRALTVHQTDPRRHRRVQAHVSRACRARTSSRAASTFTASWNSIRGADSRRPPRRWSISSNCSSRTAKPRNAKPAAGREARRRFVKSGYLSNCWASFS